MMWETLERKTKQKQTRCNNHHKCLPEKEKLPWQRQVTTPEGRVPHSHNTLFHFYLNCTLLKGKPHLVQHDTRSTSRRTPQFKRLLLATQGAEIKRITIQIKSWANTARDPILKTPITKKSW
jgi:hypothetical protein